MKKTTKRFLSCLLAAAMVLALAACGGGTKTRGDENQSDFLIVGGMSTLSSGNDSNPVLVELAENAGVEIEWDLMSDSLGEKVGVLIGGNQLPDKRLCLWAVMRKELAAAEEKQDVKSFYSPRA